MKRLQYACYSANATMSVVGNLSPVLFLTFRTLYDISYSKLGLLVLINFVTQLVVDLLFSLFPHRFPIAKTVRSIPFIAIFGFLVYALWPFFCAHNVFLGLVIGTVIFSAASGFNEVLISPVIAAIPSENPEREMSKLHSVYAWGVVAVIAISTLFLLFVGPEYWQWLTIFFLIVPLTSAILFAGAEIPVMETPKHTSGALRFLKNAGVWYCVLAIFLGGASECAMAQWSSSYLEMALGIPKVWGDLCGVALFSLMLGLGRTLYAKFGKHVERVLLLGAIGAFLCYLVAALSPFPLVGLVACALTGFCVSMLWPGNLVVASDKYPMGGVLIYAMMAAGGDLGASAVPFFMGVITDAVMVSPVALELAPAWQLTVEQLGMKVGMLFSALFPLMAIPIYARICRRRKHTEKTDTVKG